MFRDFTKYEVYEDGRIWSYSHKKFLKPATNKKGYQRVCLVDNEGKQKLYLVHRVVWEAITGEPIPEGMQINHRNEIKTSNMISNLELVTPKENNNYGSRNTRAGKSISKANTNNPNLSKSLTNNPKLSKRVGAFKNDELVIVFTSISEAQRQGFNKGAVSKCCNGNRKTHKGYEWRYLDK